jgi:hypothetical protein
MSAAKPPVLVPTLAEIARVTTAGALGIDAETLDVLSEVVAEAQRLDGGDGRSLRAMLREVRRSALDVAAEEAGDTPEDRRTILRSLAAWALLAILRHDAAPTAALDAMPAGRLL